MARQLKQADLAAISQRTIAHYNQRAEEFRQATQDHDVRQNIDALLRHAPNRQPLTLLDLGCGPGRDLKQFKALGHIAIGLEGSERFCRMARAYSDCEILHQDLLEMDLPAGHFDGIYANAVLFQIPAQELPRVLGELYRALTSGGVVFASNPHGHNEEGWFNGRYACYHDQSRWFQFMTGAGFSKLEHYYRPAGLPRAQQPWLASVWRKNQAR